MDDGFAGPGPDARFLAFLQEGRFMIQRSAATGACVFPPRTAAPGTGATDLEWIAASGAGTVHATTVIRARPEAGGSYNVALIDLAEGPRMMSRVEGIAPEAVTIGMAVTARITAIDGQPAVVFDPADTRTQG